MYNVNAFQSIFFSKDIKNQKENDYPWSEINASITDLTGFTWIFMSELENINILRFIAIVSF